MGMIPDVSAMVTNLENEDKSAYYLSLSILNYKDYSCRLYAPYVDNYPKFASVALPKSSPFYEFFQFAVLKQFENGQLDNAGKQWNNLKCGGGNSQEGGGEFKSMGFEKLNFLFGILCLGYTLSILIGIAEQLKRFLFGKYDDK